MKRGQSAVEFLILVGAMLFFFVTFLFTFQGNLTDYAVKNQNEAVVNVAYTVQDEVRLASVASDGYSRTFTIPNDVNGDDYTIEIAEGSVSVKTSNGKYAVALPLAHVIGNVAKGTNTIRKENGVVYLNS